MEIGKRFALRTGSNDGNALGFLSVNGFELGIIDLFGQALEDHFAIFEGDGAGGIAMHQVQEVQAAKHGDAAFFVQLFKILEDRMRQNGIQRGDRFIRQDQLGILHQGAGDAHALLLPARERIGAHVGLIGQAHLVEAGDRLACGLRLRTGAGNWKGY